MYISLCLCTISRGETKALWNGGPRPQNKRATHGLLWDFIGRMLARWKLTSSKLSPFATIACFMIMALPYSLLIPEVEVVTLSATWRCARQQRAVHFAYRDTRSMQTCEDCLCLNLDVCLVFRKYGGESFSITQRWGVRYYVTKLIRPNIHWSWINW